MSETVWNNLRAVLALFAAAALLLALVKVIFVLVKIVLRHYGREWDDSGFWRGVWDFVRYGFTPREEEEDEEKKP